MAGTLFVAVLPGALWGAYELIRWSVPTEPPKGLEDAQKEKLKSLSQSLSEGTSKPIESLQDPLPPGSPVFDDDSAMAQTMKSIKVSDVYLPKPVIVLDVDMCIKDVLELLGNKKISSAPVIDSAGVGDNKIIGFVDVLDLAGYMLNILREKGVGADAEALFKSQTLRHVCDETTNIYSSLKWVGIYEEDHLYHLMQVFGRGVHRVPVFRRVFDKAADKEIDQICGVISQSTVIDYLYKHRETVLGEVADKPISELKNMIIPRPYIYSVHPEYPAWNAFENLYRARMSAAAIVSDDDILLGNISTSHLKGVRLSNFSTLADTVQQVVETLSPEKKMNALAAHFDTPLHYILYHLKATHMHRCWVVEHCSDEAKKLRVVHVGRAEKTKLLGLITLTDICKVLVGSDTAF
mmetsp:Transcript_28516/g.71679  ORF Transcript_28516/g.71679 Transcript_28516/m.71679 type:complete len:408 (-) Transcript_28516:128-1351(-)|eukprot:CAMPEP_0177635972 /NCGR_PEP_ID=MMETSP0447-20121125/4189_1 /TAXON_ID=0 /ORGANISM="Stygamoeba regulata, Strain BSH-02190019" /LENGTH=407 /DNA_ID=CAMNT_0019137801 /DNA_START=120 /DNA_END=1343 /DNA_ORIENTATION=-